VTAADPGATHGCGVWLPAHVARLLFFSGNNRD
jgi:hypothetical protein